MGLHCITLHPLIHQLQLVTTFDRHGFLALVKCMFDGTSRPTMWESLRGQEGRCVGLQPCSDRSSLRPLKWKNGRQHLVRGMLRNSQVLKRKYFCRLVPGGEDSHCMNSMRRDRLDRYLSSTRSHRSSISTSVLGLPKDFARMRPKKFQFQLKAGSRMVQKRRRQHLILCKISATISCGVRERIILPRTLYFGV
jgi:hypothetical protein